MTISAEDFLAFLPRYVWHMEEPVCEPPAVALYYVTELARQHVKVLLSGEGGDEGFAGYQNYRNLLWLERLKRLGGFPAGAAAAGFELLWRASGNERWRRFAHVMRHDLADYYWSRTAGPWSPFAQAKPALYTPEFQAELAKAQSEDFIRPLFDQVRGDAPLNRMLYVDTKTWLPDDLLIKADKMTMANSVELRVPLLDHRVLEFAAALPPRMKIKGFRTKHILKEALRDRVPREILERRKTGFPVPYGKWLAGELKGFVLDVLTDPRTRGRGYFDDRAVTALLQRFDAGFDLSAEIFSLLTLELWHRAFIDGDLVPAPPLERMEETGAPRMGTEVVNTRRVLVLGATSIRTTWAWEPRVGSHLHPLQMLSGRRDLSCSTTAVNRLSRRYMSMGRRFRYRWSICVSRGRCSCETTSCTCSPFRD